MLVTRGLGGPCLRLASGGLGTCGLPVVPVPPAGLRRYVWLRSLKTSAGARPCTTWATPRIRIGG